MIDSDDYKQIFLTDAPLIDTRAPIEFAKGAFPNAVNMPLMTDAERARVGTCYKQNGQEAAIVLGHKLVAGAVKDERVQAWVEFAQQNPQGLIYCFRGGLRSRTSQQWLADAGVNYPRVIGGYKAMRTFLIEVIEQAASECQFTVLSGLTGTGKTDVLVPMAQAFDLEGLANHRGSSFGKHVSAQPNQIDFENKLAITLLKMREAGIQNFFVENESRTIGSCAVPLALYNRMQQAPMVVLTASLADRVERVLRDYVVRLRVEFIQALGEEQGNAAYSEHLLQGLKKISKRLGGLRYQRLESAMQDALEQQLQHEQLDAHRIWIQALLENYYDPMYHYQQQKNKERVCFAGGVKEVQAYLQAG